MRADIHTPGQERPNAVHGATALRFHSFRKETSRPFDNETARRHRALLTDLPISTDHDTVMKRISGLVRCTLSLAAPDPWVVNVVALQNFRCFTGLSVLTPPC